MGQPTDSEIRTLLHSSARVLVVAHIRPDGDAVGSMLGLGLALEAAGKTVQMVCPEGVPPAFRHLSGCEKILRKQQGDIDLAVVVDASDLPRTGGVLGDRIPDLVIDHHVTNDYFGKTNLVIPDSVATCAILAEYLPRWGLTVTPVVAQALLTGILTDSIGFRTSNTSPNSLRLAAGLMEAGANLTALYTQVLLRRSFEAASYWGHALSRMQRSGGVIWTTLTLADRALAGYLSSDDADLCNVLSTIEKADVSVLFVEQKDGSVKISWRAMNGCDVSRLAAMFGGGGHAAAAGADVAGSLPEVSTKVLQATQTYLLEKSSEK